MATIEKRLIALELGAAVATCATSEPYWSESHRCMMADCGGFILPIVLTPEAWESAAREHMDLLTQHE
jgi:hypothetical protein